jgi:peptidoglycan/LPS O-acetylase OafA/YrhL
MVARDWKADETLMARSPLPMSNNFDLVRLFAALQVAAVHSLQHLKVTIAWPIFGEILQLFPGVPIFFFVSGFLISRSYDRNPSVGDFTLNRCLRIYPALIVCLVVSIATVISTGYFRSVRVEIAQLAPWVAAQLTFAQFYNPQFMRYYGVGVLNGSVWTICVELQFYVLTPVIHQLCSATCKTKAKVNILILGLIGVFLVVNRSYFAQTLPHGESLAYKILGVSFIPWFYMFLAGIVVQKNLDFFRAILSGKFTIVLPAYLVFSMLVGIHGGLRLGNEISPFLFTALIATVFAAAFSNEGLSDRLLRRNDISYGVYIYHMPIVNLLLTLGYVGSSKALGIAIAATIALALASWLAVEKPALSLKKHALYSHVAPNS